ncbi:MAG TPA: phenylacetate--CoA ligase [Firmicutes bacterium]|nr:phenylacetate--CoA ligase [Bacillota bacterium]
MQKKETERYWNPFLETLSPQEMKRIQFKKFKRMVEWAYLNSKLYRRLYDAAGFKPGDLKRWEDIPNVPIVQKEDYRRAQAREPWPYGDSLSVPLDEITEYHQTSGTTGQPVYQADTWQDWEWWTEMWAYMLWAQGLRKSDRVFILSGYNVNMSSWASHYASEKVGCEVIPGGILNTEERLLKIKELRANVIMASPSYVFRMEDTCKNKLHMDPRELKIEKILCTGEPGANVPSTKRQIEEAWGAKVYDNAMATEVGGWGFECTSQPGGLHANEAFFLIELVDIDRGYPIQELHIPGKIVVTTFDRYAQPCIRFDTKDISMWGKPCQCGRTFRILKGGIHGRADEITKIKGVLFNPLTVEEVVLGTQELADDYFLEVKEEDSAEILVLKVEKRPGVCLDTKTLERNLARQLRLKTNLTFQIEFQEYGTLLRPEVKIQRFRDMRVNK